MEKYGVIMAGGGGTRFWPLSRQATPKQLLNLSGKDVMLNEAIARLSKVVKRENIFIVTNSAQGEAVRTVTAGRLPKENVLEEPAARNTSACIGYAAVLLQKKFGDGVMIVTPSDAYIRDEEEFARVLRKAATAAERADKLVTIGITPTFPATGYGYIRCEGEGEVKDVLRFVEKPNEELAKEYLASGKYLWNSGMFLWKVSVILQKYRELLPDVYAGLEQLQSCIGEKDEREKIGEIYPTIPAVSVDYGIMERATGVLTVPGEFGWNDVGSWDMLGVLHEADGDGNVTVGDCVLAESCGNILYSSGRTIAVVGVKDLVVAETADAVLVCPKERAQDVKKIVEKLKAEGKKELL
jgi:mannose-1-phosphate guanylyltransferase